MADRRPLILDNGLIKELPIGDTVVGTPPFPMAMDGETIEPMMIPGPQGPTGPAGTGGSGGGSIGPPGIDGVDADEFPFLTEAINRASGLEIDAGTSSNLITPASIASSKNVPHVAPGSLGNILSSDGTNWVSSVPSTIAGIPSGIFAAPRTGNTEDDEFEATSLNVKWTATGGTPTTSSYDDHIRSAAYYIMPSGVASDTTLTQSYANAGNFSITACVSISYLGSFSNLGIQVSDSTGANTAEVRILSNGTTPVTNTVKTVATVVTGGAFVNLLNPPPFIFLHLQRTTNNWSGYYSYDGINWVLVNSAMAVTMTVAKLQILFGNGGAGAFKTNIAVHWFRRDWVTL